MTTACQNFHWSRGFLVFVGLLLTLPCFAADTNQWKVQVTGLRVITPSTDTKHHSYNGALMAPPGMAVEVRLRPPYGKIVSINQFASQVDSFADDQGTDLLAPKTDNPFSKPGLGIMDCRQGSYATVDIKAAGLPAKGATSLDISGTAALQIATGKKEFTMENVEMRKNTAFHIGDLPLKISTVGTNRNSWMAKQYPYSVEFSSERDLVAIESLKFFDEHGNEIKARKSSWGGGPGNYVLEYDLQKNAGRAKIVATCWEGLKQVNVPISVKTGLGL